MTTGIIVSSEAQGHFTGKFHPESPVRFRAVMDGLRSSPAFSEDQISHIGQFAPARALYDVHSVTYVRALQELGRGRTHKPFHLDPDVIVSSSTFSTALCAAGLGVYAVDKILHGEMQNAFCITRPPGHHARRNTAMGFCFFNNVAIAAAHALDFVPKVAIVDFDMHHGNGTEEWARKHGEEVAYFSIHKAEDWPGTGQESTENIHNYPLASKNNSFGVRNVMTKHLLPALRSFNPDFLFVSAGFDGHKDEELSANLGLTTGDYGWMTNQLREAARECCRGRLVSVLEGGYNPVSLAAASRAHMEALQGKWEPRGKKKEVLTGEQLPSKEALLTYTKKRLEKGMPSGMYLDMIEHRFHLLDKQKDYPSWMEDLWALNASCLGGLLQKSLAYAKGGHGFAARHSLDYVFTIVRTLKKTPLAFVADNIKDIQNFCDPEEPSAPAIYHRLGSQKNDPRYKKLGKIIEAARYEP